MPASVEIWKIMCLYSNLVHFMQSGKYSQCVEHQISNKTKTKRSSMLCSWLTCESSYANAFYKAIIL